MNLVLTKNSEGQTDLQLMVSGELEEFSYVRMIEYMVNEETLDNSEFTGDFTDEEVAKVEAMVEKINTVVQPIDENSGEDNDESNAVYLGDEDDIQV
jgi:hypothetical protein